LLLPSISNQISGTYWQKLATNQGSRGGRLVVNALPQK
jgi:hypothetical protein